MKISFVVHLIKIKMRNVITVELWRRLVEDRRIKIDGSLGKNNNEMTRKDDGKEHELSKFRGNLFKVR